MVNKVSKCVNGQYFGDTILILFITQWPLRDYLNEVIFSSLISNSSRFLLVRKKNLLKKMPFLEWYIS